MSWFYCIEALAIVSSEKPLRAGNVKLSCIGRKDKKGEKTNGAKKVEEAFQSFTR
jgi:hypothetical protein